MVLRQCGSVMDSGLIVCKTGLKGLQSILAACQAQASTTAVTQQWSYKTSMSCMGVCGPTVYSLYSIRELMHGDSRHIQSSLAFQESRTLIRSAVSAHRSRVTDAGDYRSQ